MNISIGQNCLNKKPIEYIVHPSPSRGVGTKSLCTFYYYLLMIRYIKSELMISYIKTEFLVILSLFVIKLHFVICDLGIQ